MKKLISSIFIVLVLLALSISSGTTKEITKTSGIQQVVTICENTKSLLNNTVNDMFEQGWETERAPYYNPDTKQWCQQLHN